MATKTAAAGTFVSQGGDDFIHFVDRSGNTMSRVDSSGVQYSSDYSTHDGVSLSGLWNQVNNMVVGGLFLDAGNFDSGPFFSVYFIDGGTY